MIETIAWHIPPLIYLARICDVSIGTMRTMMVIAGYRVLAACLGFFEVTIWVLAVAAVLEHLTNPFAIVAYAAGYASGVLVGMFMENKIALGYRLVRAIIPGENGRVTSHLRELGYRVTRIVGAGRDGPVEIIFMVVRRRALAHVRTALADTAPEAFVTIERVDRASGGEFLDSRFARRPISVLAAVGLRK